MESLRTPLPTSFRINGRCVAIHPHKSFGKIFWHSFWFFGFFFWFSSLPHRELSRRVESRHHRLMRVVLRPNRKKQRCSLLLHRIASRHFPSSPIAAPAYRMVPRPHPKHKAATTNRIAQSLLTQHNTTHLPLSLSLSTPDHEQREVRRGHPRPDREQAVRQGGGRDCAHGGRRRGRGAGD